jgi:uncharacterized protein (UPF0264 family)
VHFLMSQLISANGRTLADGVMKDVQAGTPGANFPWVPKPVANLGERSHRRGGACTVVAVRCVHWQAGTPGANFPWVPKPMANLGERSHRRGGACTVVAVRCHNGCIETCRCFRGSARAAAVHGQRCRTHLR